MSQTEDIEEEYLTCYICYDVFTEPKTLACLHRFCERCLQGYLVGLSETARKNGIPCPVCRERTPAPDPRRPPADWAALIRTDFHLKSLIKALQAGGGNKQSGGGKGGKRGDGSQPCQLHGDKELDLYCVDCRSSICHLCAGISHRGCSQVITLAEAAADHRATVHLRHRHLAQRLDTLAGLKVQLDRAMDGLSDQRAAAEACIRRSSQAALTAVRRRETEEVERLTVQFQTLKGDVTKRLLAVDNKMTSCQQALNKMGRQLQTTSDTEVVRSVGAMLDQDSLDSDEQRLRNMLTRLESIRLEYQPSEKHDISLGDISLGLSTSDSILSKTPSKPPATSPRVLPNTPPKPSIIPRRNRSQTIASMVTYHVPTAPVKLRTISGKFREDRQSSKLRDVLVIPEEKLVLAADWANQCVKAFHERRERDGRLSLGGKPWCLTRVTRATVAVSLPVSSQICVLKVLPRLMLQSSFLAQKRYSGLATLDADTLVASGGSDPPCVDIINMGGEVLRSFSRDAMSHGRQLFAYPSYITMMPDRKRFLVSDRRKSALFCLDTSGHVLFTFRPEGSMGLREPSGVAVDVQGGIYLAETRGLVKLTNDGKLDRALLRSQDGVEDPRGVALSCGGLLYLTSKEEDIVVFKLT